MARVKRSVNGRKSRKATLKKAKGHYGNRSRSFRSANESVMHAGNYAFRVRRARKGEMRRLWVQRINAGCRQHGTSYSRFIFGLKEAESRSTARSSLISQLTSLTRSRHSSRLPRMLPLTKGQRPDPRAFCSEPTGCRCPASAAPTSAAAPVVSFCCGDPQARA